MLPESGRSRSVLRMGVCGLLVSFAALTFGRVQTPAGKIQGRVIDGITGLAIPGASITLRRVSRQAFLSVRPPTSASANANQAPVRILSASDGTFLFSAVGAGDYALTAGKVGFSLGAFGQTSPRDSVQGFELRDGEQATGVVVPLWRGGAVSGTVTSSAGKPLARRWVQLIEIASERTGLRVQSLQPEESTDDQGKYRFGELPPGRYVVRVSTSAPPLFGAEPFPGPVEPSSMFYPHQGLPSRAGIITIAPGDERTNVDLEVPDAGLPGYQLMGRIMGFPLASVDGVVRLVLVDGDAALVPNLEFSRTSVRYDGSFVFPYVPNGSYQVRGVVGSGLSASELKQGPKGLRFGSPIEQPLSSSAPATFWFSQTVEVRDKSIAGVLLQAHPGARVLGRIDVSPELNGLDSSRIAVTAHSLDGWNLDGLPVGRVGPDGKLWSAGLPPGRHVVLPQGGEWFADGATLNGTDVMSTGISIADSDVSGLVVALTRLKAEVTGKITDAAGNSRADARVLYLRSGGAWSSTLTAASEGRDIGQGRTNRFGDYRMQLNAGEYHLVAVAGAMPETWEPAFLSSLVPKSTKVLLTRGTTKTVNLQVQRLPK